MADPLRLAAALAEIGIARYAQSEWKRTGATLLLKVVSVVCAGLGGGFAVASFLIYLIPVVGAAEATLIVGGTLLVVSLVATGIGLSMARRTKATGDRPAPGSRGARRERRGVRQAA